MKDRGQISKRSVWLGLLALVLLLGVMFRVVGLGDRVYWVDEVATSIRISGYTRAEVVAQLSDGLPRTPAQVQQFLHPAPDLPLSQVLDALMQSPEHAPLYFLLAHGWTHLWGSSVVALRSLSVVCSLVALGLMGRLAAQLFSSLKAGAIALSLLALSPFFVSYAQEARPYSLWSAMLLWSGVALWGAMRRPTLWRWLHYAVAATLGLYTSLLSALVLLGQGLYVLWLGDGKQRNGVVLAAGLTVFAFLPWGWVALQQWGRLHANTEWMREPMGILPLLFIWLYNTSVLLFDVPATLSPDLPTAAKLLTSVGLVGLMAIALCTLQRQTPPRVWGFVLLFAGSIPVVLLGLDLVRNSQISTAARYLLPFHLGLILALAFFLSHLLAAKSSRRRTVGRGIAMCLVLLCFLSYGFQQWQPPKYQKSRNLHNRAIAALINQTSAPRLMAEPIHALDLISLSLDLNPDALIQVAATLNVDSLRPALQVRSCQPLFLLNPSTALKTTIQASTKGQFVEIYHPQKLVPNELALSLWQLSCHHTTLNSSSLKS